MFKNVSRIKEYRAAQEASKMQSEEIERRKFCVQQAAWLDETRPENLLKVADTIYAYVWGQKS